MNNPQSYGLIGWFAKNPVAANLLMLFIIVAGAISAVTISKDMFPRTDRNSGRYEDRFVPNSKPDFSGPRFRPGTGDFHGSDCCLEFLSNASKKSKDSTCGRGFIWSRFCHERFGLDCFWYLGMR